MSGPVVVLAGGTGGAKLARGMLDVVGAQDLVVIANTGDDIEIYGGYVSPDVDLVSFWLTDTIDERGWGLAGDTFGTMDGLRDLGVEVWFSLGDRDLAIALERARALERGERATEVELRMLDALGVPGRVLPMSDQPVRTFVLTRERWISLQEYLIRERGLPEVLDVRFRGAHAARATPEVLKAIAQARAIVIGPSNPIISIGPILAIDEIRAALKDASAPVVAVSPFVHGKVLKGPTAQFLSWRGLPLAPQTVATLYDGLIDGLVADEPAEGCQVLLEDVLMQDAEGRSRLAERTLAFATELGGHRTR
jgi:LPPG:FO 2-phospho-L-lactate transferase